MIGSKKIGNPRQVPILSFLEALAVLAANSDSIPPTALEANPNLIIGKIYADCDEAAASVLNATRVMESAKQHERRTMLR